MLRSTDIQSRGEDLNLTAGAGLHPSNAMLVTS